MLIIGGGFAGLNCARSLGNDQRFEVTLLDRENQHLFQPLLYQVETAALLAPDIARSLRAILRKAKNVRVILEDVKKIHQEKKKVVTGNKNYSYDSLAFRYKDKGIMAITGKSAAIAETEKMSLRGFPAWMPWPFIHLAFLVGYQNKIAVLVSWAFTYIFDKLGARVFSSEEGCKNSEISPPL